jgi:hypothetical protein
VAGAEFVSMGKNSAFEGRQLRGRVLATFVSGSCVYGADGLAPRCTGGALSVSRLASCGVRPRDPNVK